MLRAMRARGLDPVITLNHFTLPLWALHPRHDQNCVNGLGNVLGNTVLSGGLGLVTIFASACFPSLASADNFSSFQGWATCAVNHASVSSLVAMASPLAVADAVLYEYQRAA
jgi:beta-glucosidase/6-phospho-beta-glucosidase/beta-galactosidase